MYSNKSWCAAYLPLSNEWYEWEELVIEKDIPQVNFQTMMSTNMPNGASETVNKQSKKFKLESGLTIEKEKGFTVNYDTDLANDNVSTKSLADKDIIYTVNIEKSKIERKKVIYATENYFEP